MSMNAHDGQFPESSIDPDTVHGGHESTAMEGAPTPLPKLQLFTVLAPKLAGSITATCVRPFVNQFIRETGITGGDERKTGYYAGIIESAFAFSQCLSVVLWGYLSDRFGRRPILLLGPLGLAFSMLAFGSSNQFWTLVVARYCQGIFMANLEIVKAILAELADSTNMGDAYGLMLVTYSIGATAGPVVGGALSNPAVRFPNNLGRIDFLKEHPYFLPCAVAASLSFATWAIANAWLKETLPAILAREKLDKQRGDTGSEETRIYEATSEESSLLVQGEHVDSGTSHCQYDEPCLQKPPIEGPGIAALMTRPLIITYLNRTYLGFLETCDTALLPLMYSTSIPLGGLGLDPFQIGVAMGSFGFINSIVQLNYLGRMTRKLGARKLYILSFMHFLICFGVYPLMSYFAQRAGRVDWIVLALMVVQLASGMGAYMAYAAIQVVVVENVPPGSGLATANGICQTLSSGIRTIAPSFASSLFAVSLTRQLLGGHLVYYVLLAMTLVGMRLSHHLSDGRNRGRPRL